MVHNAASATLSVLERAFSLIVKALTVFITGRKTPAYHPSRPLHARTRPEMARQAWHRASR